MADLSHDLMALLSSESRDFLIRNDGGQMKISSLMGKTVALYFSGSWCGPCRHFTPTLCEVYENISSTADFEVVFISSDRSQESFNEYFSKMPWLAIPFSDSATIKHLKDLFRVRGIPNLAILDKEGKVLTDQGVRIMRDHGSDAYPFTPERISVLKQELEEAKKNQTLSSVLVSDSCDHLISNGGVKIPISELEGKTVGLYFSVHSMRSCEEFTQKLVEVYGKLKEAGENFEIVLISLDFEDGDLTQGFSGMPWLALPFNEKVSLKLTQYFEIKSLPTLVVLGTDGKTLHQNVAGLIEEHGSEAYPFTPEKLVQLAEIEKARLESQTLESILVQEEHDFVIDKSGSKVSVSELAGKNILLYFSAHWCHPCRVFLPKLINAYHEIKAKDESFEVIFISRDRDQSSFDDFFSGMPWLALPFGDPRKASLVKRFKIRGIPAAIAISPTGQTVTTDARNLIIAHGGDAYPFTEEHLKHLEARLEEIAKGWPEKIKHELHAQHELVRTRRSGYMCNGCLEMGIGWSFCCKQCNFDLHPKCCLKMDEGSKTDGQGETGKANSQAWICDGDVCRKA